jgi:hypothetical protein
VREGYTAVLLAKFQILEGGARRPSILPVGLPYVGYVLVVLVVAEWLKEQESNKLRFNRFFDICA